MISIESKNNTLFKQTKKLKEKRYQVKTSKFLIEGFRLVEEALKANVHIEYLFVEDDEWQKFEPILSKYFSTNNLPKMYQISKSLIKELCSTENPQGIVAVIDQKFKEFDYKGSFYVICDKVQDPGNLGTIIRTAHAADVDGIILTKGTTNVYSDKVLRSTMGSIFYVPIIYDDSNYSVIKKLKDNKFKIVATSLQASNNFYEEDLKGKVAVTIGNEGNGVSDDVYDLCTEKVKLPMPGGAESLNVSICASIIMYERIRQCQK